MDGSLFMKDLVKRYNMTDYKSVYQLRKEFKSWNEESLLLSRMYDMSGYKGLHIFDIYSMKLKSLTKRSMIQNFINGLINKFGLVK